MFIRLHNYLLVSLLTLFSALSIHANEAQSNTDISEAEWQDIYSQMYENKKAIPSTTASQLGQSYLKASNVDAGDRDGNGDGFGSSVAIDGQTLVIGAKFEDGDMDNTLSSGAAYVFIKTNGTWTEQAYLTASNATNSDEFGQSVAISGDTIVVGSPFEDSNTSSSGAVYVFTRSSNNWTEQTILKASNPGIDESFGYSVDIDGNFIVVGAYTENGADNGMQDDAGAAYVFTGSGANWSEQAYLQANNIGSGDNFGVSVAIDNDTIVIGADEESGADNNLENGIGAAYVFIRSGANWTEQQSLSAANGAAKDNFGISVDISGESIVVGALQEGGSGAAYVFTRTGVSWSEQAKLKSLNAGADDAFGNVVTIDGDSIVVGANFEDGDGVAGLDNNLETDSGAAYLFTRSNTSWTQQSYLKASNTDNLDEFGTAVALSGTNILVSAPGEDSAFINNQSDNTFDSVIFGAGAAYVFDTSILIFSDGFE
jgi:hypothetical protein